MAFLTPKDQDLIALLRVNAREPVSALARKLGLSRTTVQDRLRRLEQSGIIAGYQLRLSESTEPDGIRAFVTMEVEPRRTHEVARVLQKMPQVEALYSVSGKYDLGTGHGQAARPCRGGPGCYRNRIRRHPVDQGRSTVGRLKKG
jgi:DNA-binding Lrp family transcriptional regulator